MTGKFRSREIERGSFQICEDDSDKTKTDHVLIHDDADGIIE